MSPAPSPASGAQQSLSRSRQMSVRHSSSSDGVTVGAKVERRGGGSSDSQVSHVFLHASCAVCESPWTSHLVGRSSLTHWQFFASSPFLCQVTSSAQAGGEGSEPASGEGSAGGAGSAGGGEGSAGPETGGGVCAWIEASIRAALSIVRRDIFFVCLVSRPKLLLADVRRVPMSQDF